MAVLRYTFGGNYTDSYSAPATGFFEYIYQGQNVSYQSIIDGNLLKFTSNPSNGWTNQFNANTGFLQDFSDNIADVNLSGGIFGDILRGGFGNDTLNGGDGNDVLEGGAGSDTFDGGAGIDTVSYEHSTASVTIQLLGQTNGFAAFVDGAGDSWAGIENARGGSGGDIIFSDADADRNVLEGGGGADALITGSNDIVTYEHSSAGVTANLTTGIGSHGDAEGDTFSGVQNLSGSSHDDTLIGNADANELRGGGGGDILHGLGGNDRLVITETPTNVDGGADTDALFILGDGTIVLTDENFANIETVYVRGDTTLDMSGVSVGQVIVSQSIDQHFVEITGTSDNDTISAGMGFDQIHGGAGDDVIKGGNGTGQASASILYGDAGNDVITAGKGIAYILGGDGNDTIRGASGVGLLSGGADSDRIIAGARGFDIDGGNGADKLFAGLGEDTFNFQADFGRDNVYRFDVNTDHITVSIAGATSAELAAFHGGQDTIVTFAGVEGTNKIILHDVTVDQIKEGPSDLFIFGA